jgi:hypothetical protein
MKFNKLASLIAKKECKKKQVTIGNVREILALISEVFYQEKDFPKNIQTYQELLKIGQKRAKRKKA